MLQDNEGFHFFSTSVGPYENQTHDYPTHFTSSYVSPDTKQLQHGTKKSVMICGMIVTTNMLFSCSYYIHYSNNSVNMPFYYSFVLSAFFVCLTV